MGSTSEARPPSRLPIVKQPDLTGLRECVDLMGSIESRSFDATYGNLRVLLQLELQTDAIIALSQFYVPDLRCFIFKNSQLSPTLEEYTEILGFPRLSVVPYQYQKPYYSDEKLASLLQGPVSDLKLQKTERNGVIVFPLKFFVTKLQAFARTGRWGLFKPLLALAIFGTVLFPQIDGYIDTIAVGIFLAFKNKENPINPIPAILADTYCTFTHYFEQGGKRISCSLHVLYAWFLTHAFINKGKTDKLLKYAMGCVVETMNAQKWMKLLKSFNEHQIRWYTLSCWEDRPKVLFQCGTFQNVPLMGTKGCVNYNPSLTLRQLGYPMRNPPTDDMLFRFYLHEKGPKDDNLLRRILQSWETVVYKGKGDLAKRIGNRDVTFYQWLQSRTQNVCRPSQKMFRDVEEVPEPKSTDEVLEETRMALYRAEEEKKSLQMELEKMALKNKRLEDENALNATTIENSNKRLKVEEKDKQEAQRYLKGAKEEIKRCKLKLKEAIEDANEWKSLWEKSAMEKKVAQSSLAKSERESRMLIAELENQIKGIKQDRDAIEKILRDYQQALRGEQERYDELKSHLQYLEEVYHQVKFESQHWENRFMDLIGKIESQEVIIELRNESQYWKSQFSKLVGLANQAIIDVPKRLKRAEAAMHPFNTPVKVCEFMEFCGALIMELKEAAKDATVKKRERSGELKAICG